MYKDYASLVPSLSTASDFLHVGKNTFFPNAFFPTCRNILAVETGYEARIMLQLLLSSLVPRLSTLFVLQVTTAVRRPGNEADFFL